MEEMCPLCNDDEGDILNLRNHGSHRFVAYFHMAWDVIFEFFSER